MRNDVDRKPFPLKFQSPPNNSYSVIKTTEPGKSPRYIPWNFGRAIAGFAFVTVNSQQPTSNNSQCDTRITDDGEDRSSFFRKQQKPNYTAETKLHHEPIYELEQQHFTELFFRHRQWQWQWQRGQRPLRWKVSRRSPRIERLSLQSSKRSRG